jgi:translation initiation factor IF-3
LSRPFPSRSSSSQHSGTRVNGKIRAREVRVIGPEGQQLGVFSLVDAINMARAQGVDLVEVSATANPPVCRIIDFGKYRYEQNQKDKESKKHQHANKVKEIQLSPGIDPHDFGVKLAHAIDFLCKDMKLKVVLKFRGREMAHKEIGFQQIEKFTQALAPYGHPDYQPKLVGRGVTVMFSPHPRNKRAKNPRGEQSAQDGQSASPPHSIRAEVAPPGPNNHKPQPRTSPQPGEEKSGGFANNPFTGLQIPPPE